MSNNISLNRKSVKPSSEVLRIAEWLEEQARSVSYGDVAVSVSIHASRITKVSKTITTKEQTEVGHSHDGSR